MALPRGTTGSLWPTFVSARPVGLAVRLAYAIALEGRFPTALSQPSRASVTLWEATAQSNSPPCRVPAPARGGAVRGQRSQGWYFKGGSPEAGASASQPPTYPTHGNPGTTAKL